MLVWQTCLFEILANCCFSIEAWECDMCPDRIYAHTYIKIRISIPCTYVCTYIHIQTGRSARTENTGEHHCIPRYNTGRAKERMIAYVDIYAHTHCVPTNISFGC